MKTNTQKLENLVFSVSIQDTKEPYKYLYLLAIYEILYLKRYCDIDHLSSFLQHHYKIVHRWINSLERDGLVYMKKGMIILSREGKQEVNKMTNISSATYARLTENRNDIKRKDDDTINE